MSTKDCNGKTIPVYKIADVVSCTNVKVSKDASDDSSNIYNLKVKICVEPKSLPLAGQFYMLKAVKGNVLLSRPISLYNVEVATGDGTIERPSSIESRASKEKFASNGNGGSKGKVSTIEKRALKDVGLAKDLVSNGNGGSKENPSSKEPHASKEKTPPNFIHATLEFLILQKGKGTQELCHLQKNDKIEILGPLGNSFTSPNKIKQILKILLNKKPLIIGGGIGVAPVAGFARTLEKKSYDFIACFKSGKYGLNKICANKLTVTTDDGSVGVKGMLPQVFDEQVANRYSVVYACGPTPMLKYVKEICDKANVLCYLSMESKMACGGWKKN